MSLFGKILGGVLGGVMGKEQKVPAAPPPPKLDPYSNYAGMFQDPTQNILFSSYLANLGLKPVMSGPAPQYGWVDAQGNPWKYVDAQGKPYMPPEAQAGGVNQGVFNPTPWDGKLGSKFRQDGSSGGASGTAGGPVWGMLPGTSGKQSLSYEAAGEPEAYGFIRQQAANAYNQGAAQALNDVSRRGIFRSGTTGGMLSGLANQAAQFQTQQILAHKQQALNDLQNFLANQQGQQQNAWNADQGTKAAMYSGQVQNYGNQVKAAQQKSANMMAGATAGMDLFGGLFGGSSGGGSAPQSPLGAHDFPGWEGYR